MCTIAFLRTMKAPEPILLSLVNHLDPHWFNSVRNGVHDCLTNENGIVVLKGIQLPARGLSLPPNTPYKVWLSSSGHFVCRSVAEQQLLDQRQQDLHEHARREQQRLLDDYATRSRAYESSLNLPAAWAAGIKDVLSGLSERSWGDGLNKASVIHIMLLNDLAHGRLKRRAGDLLCSSSQAANGKNWSNQRQHTQLDSSGCAFTPEITCKSCRAIASRWRIPQATDWQADQNNEQSEEIRPRFR